MNLFEAEIIFTLQKISNPFLDYLFFAITLMGSEYFFIAIAAIIFWCINKKYGFKFFFVFILSQFVIGSIKFIFSRPRPYTLKTNKGEIRGIIERTEGGSFPSGHSQNAANICTQTALVFKKKNRKHFILSIKIGLVVTILVMFSRLYLGQHFPSDVIVGAILGLLCSFFFSKLFDLIKEREELLVIIILPLSLIAAAFCLSINQNPEDIIKVLGIFAAMSLGYFLEKKFVKYNVKSGKIYKQIIKVAIGVSVIFLIKESLSFIAKQNNLTGTALMLNDFIRYFMIGIFASFLMPAFFKAVKL